MLIIMYHMIIVQSTFCAFRMIQKFFNKYLYNQLIAAASSNIWRDPLYDMFSSWSNKFILGPHVRCPNSLIFPFPLYHSFFFNSHNITEVRWMFASQRTVDNCTGVYETARPHLALPDRTRRKRLRRSGFAIAVWRIIREPLNTSTIVSAWGVARAVRIKATQTKPFPAASHSEDSSR